MSETAEKLYTSSSGFFASYAAPLPPKAGDKAIRSTITVASKSLIKIATVAKSIKYFLLSLTLIS